MIGRKYDAGKPRWDLLPWLQLGDVVKVLTHGAQKYGANNWRTVENGRDRYFAATLRHLVAWRNGERTDKESRLPHLAHAACNLLFLAWLDRGKR